MAENADTVLSDRYISFIGRAVPALQIPAIVLFFLWAKDTDFLFGHFSGPPGYLVAASALAVASLAGRVFLWRRSSQCAEAGGAGHDQYEPRIERRPLWRRGLSVLLLFFSMLIILIALLEFADSF